ncbi:putative diphosphate--fructose-6-phosphate 1-phosphotransferase [Helianthus annuus]|nr:putative diphosphate--fructose-6-phosphate 1-phosphotransferase [Helianthus annuus]
MDILVDQSYSFLMTMSQTGSNDYYEGRCGLPSNFDSNYCYALGYGAAALLHAGKTGLISSVANLGAPVKDWTIGGTPLTSLMDVERRHGKFKPVIKKAMVELQGAPFKKFSSMREEWSLKNRYINPGEGQIRVAPVRLGWEARFYRLFHCRASGQVEVGFLHI